MTDDIKKKLAEIAGKMKTATPAQKKVLSKELDKLLNTRAEESPEDFYPEPQYIGYGNEFFEDEEDSEDDILDY